MADDRRESARRAVRGATRWRCVAAGIGVVVLIVNLAGGEATESAVIGWTDSRCGACHSMAPEFTHPVGVAPSMTVPGDLPLVDGRIVCVTCHDDRSASAHGRARLEHTALLRSGLDPVELCARCHDVVGSTRADRHAGVARRAHLKWPGDGVGGDAVHGAARRFGGGGLDEESHTCLSCHDGLAARDGRARAGVFSATEFDGVHPVGVSYAGRGDTAADALVPVTSLDSRIRLYDDRVGCGSCHSLYADRRSLLVIANDRSRLCLSCHRY